MFAVKADVKAGSTPAIAPRQHAAFFRQSGWMMIAAVMGGAMTWGLHFLAKSPKLPERGIRHFRHTAHADHRHSRDAVADGVQPTGRRRSGAEPGTPGGGHDPADVAVDLSAVPGGVDRHSRLSGTIAAHWHLSHIAALWWTLPVLLFAFWLPMFSGVLQGQQDFFWVGG